jgi:UDP-N-acetyl-2-amino-2-deoxyglucuronate dehydrogenase
MVRFGILGAGRVTQSRYVDLFSKEVVGCKVTVVADPVMERAHKVAEALEARAVYDQDGLFLSPDVDAVIVCTESGRHHAHARAALAAGKHVVVEKPPALFPHEVEADAAFAEDRGLMYAIVFQNRLNPAIRKLKETFDSGRFGRVTLATVRLRWCRYQDYYEDGWHGTWAMDGGVINQQAIHHLDVLQYIGGPIKEVFAMQSNALNTLEAEDTTIATVRFANGVLGAIEATTAARPEDFEASLSIVAEKGCCVVGGIALNKIETWRFVDSLPDDKDVPRLYSQDVPTGYGLSHAPLIQTVIDRLTTGSIEPPLPAASAIPTISLVHALYRSVETQRPVELGIDGLSARLGV